MKNHDFSGKNLSPKFMRVLIGLDVIVLVCGIVLGGFFLYYKTYDMSAVMFAIALLGGYNCWTLWKMLKRVVKR